MRRSSGRGSATTLTVSISNEMFMGWAKMKIYFPIGGHLNRKGEMIYPYVYPTVVIALLLLAAAFIMLKYTKFGRSIYAVGGNEQSALMMGLNVRRVKLKAYMLDGFLCGIGSTLFGVLIKATIEAFITFQGTLSSWWTRITIAALLCFFIVLQSVLAMIKKKK